MSLFVVLTDICIIVLGVVQRHRACARARARACASANARAAGAAADLHVRARARVQVHVSDEVGPDLSSVLVCCGSMVSVSCARARARPRACACVCVHVRFVFSPACMRERANARVAGALFELNCTRERAQVRVQGHVRTDHEPRMRVRWDWDLRAPSRARVHGERYASVPLSYNSRTSSW